MKQGIGLGCSDVFAECFDGICLLYYLWNLFIVLFVFDKLLGIFSSVTWKPIILGWNEKTIFL